MGLTVNVGVVVGVNVAEGSGVMVEVISELEVAATVSSKATVGVKPVFIDSLFSTEELLDLVPKKYEDTPIRIASSNRITTIIIFLFTRELYY